MAGIQFLNWIQISSALSDIRSNLSIPIVAVVFCKEGGYGQSSSCCQFHIPIHLSLLTIQVAIQVAIHLATGADTALLPVILLATMVAATDLPQVTMTRKTTLPKSLQPPRLSPPAVLMILALTNWGNKDTITGNPKTVWETSNSSSEITWKMHQAMKAVSISPKITSRVGSVVYLYPPLANRNELETVSKWYWFSQLKLLNSSKKWYMTILCQKIDNERPKDWDMS